jgi:hypothetical protein
VGRDFKGGADEARGRALEKVSELETQIRARRRQLALLERENPGFAGVRAPIVSARKALGFAPKTAAEQKLTDEIAQLESDAADHEAMAQSLWKTSKEHPDIGAQEEGMKHHFEAAKLKEQASSKRAELKKLSGRR